MGEREQDGLQSGEKIDGRMTWADEQASHDMGSGELIGWPPTFAAAATFPQIHLIVSLATMSALPRLRVVHRDGNRVAGPSARPGQKSNNFCDMGKRDRPSQSDQPLETIGSRGVA